jgi:hypothetical protein
MNTAARYTSLFDEEKSILRTLLYFDIFHYPLTQKEIANFSPMPMSRDLQEFLNILVSRKYIFEQNGFYSLREDSSVISRRIAGNGLAEKKLITAKRFSVAISCVPFVRSVMLSGSISKGYMDKDSDIDYFIITAKGRLWIVRMMMALIRRIFLFNSKKYFCTNYFIDVDHLEIMEKNIFTAIETSTLKPMFGKKYVHEFQLANHWCGRFLPNHMAGNTLGPERDNQIKKFGEQILSARIFDAVEEWFRLAFIKHWNKNYANSLNSSDFSVAFQSTKNVSRSHPEFYQKKVLSQYHQKVADFEINHGLSLHL